MGIEKLLWDVLCYSFTVSLWLKENDSKGKKNTLNYIFVCFGRARQSPKMTNEHWIMRQSHDLIWRIKWDVLVVHSVGGFIIRVDGIFISNFCGAWSLLIHVRSTNQFSAEVPALPPWELHIDRHIIIRLLQKQGFLLTFSCDYHKTTPNKRQNYCHKAIKSRMEVVFESQSHESNITFLQKKTHFFSDSLCFCVILSQKKWRV